MDRIEFTRTGDSVFAKLMFNKTSPPIEEDIWLIVSYKENGVLRRVEIPYIADMEAEFEIPEELKNCEINVYVWNRDMKPLMEIQDLK